MASLGHIAVALAAARVYASASPERAQRVEGPLPSGRSILFWSALSMLPDADVIGLSLGVAYEDPLGHRGATHSFVFAVVVAVLVGAAIRLRGRPWLRATVTAAVVVATHPLLDTLTNGGLGCALFWPFDHSRYFAPWTPIPVSPIGWAYFSFYGLVVAVTEIVFFSPIVLYGLWPFRRASP